MGYHYAQLALSERIEIYRLRCEGKSLRAIASALSRSPSTISREMRRNARRTKAWSGGYRPERADALAARRRRWDGRFKLARQPELRTLVRNRLAMGWSPEQIAGRLTRENAPMRIGHESIYRFVYHRVDQKDYWNRLLPRRKGRRGRIRRGGPSTVDSIKGRVSIHDRPPEIAARKTPGHWEADLMLFSTYGHAVLVAHERTSRLLMANRQPSKAARPTADTLIRMFRPFPETLRQSVTFDNGTEFARHYRLSDTLGMKTFFCDTHAPWQKGGVENAILRLRRQLPRKTNPDEITQKEIDKMIAKYNNTPRKCLDYRTPAEAFSQHLKSLHFNRESTSPPARG